MTRREPPAATRSDNRAHRPSTASCAAAEVRIDHCRLGDDLVGTAIRDDSALVHAYEASHHLDQDVHDVLDPYHRDATIAQAYHRLDEGRRLGVREPTPDLIEKKHGGFDGQGAGQLE